MMASWNWLQRSARLETMPLHVPDSFSIVAAVFFTPDLHKGCLYGETIRRLHGGRDGFSSSIGVFVEILLPFWKR